MAHHDDVVGDLHRFFLVVGHEHVGDVHFVVQPAQPAPQVLAHLGVERAEGYVEQKHLGLDRERERACERDALALPVRQLARAAVSNAVELHQFEKIGIFLPPQQGVFETRGNATLVKASPTDAGLSAVGTTDPVRQVAFASSDDPTRRCFPSAGRDGRF